MENETYKIGTSELLIDILEKRLIVFKDRLIEEFMSGNISIYNIIEKEYLKLFNSVELQCFFQEIDYAFLNYGELNYLIVLGDKNAYDALKKRFNLITKEKISVLINEGVKRNVASPEFNNLPELKQLLKKINNRQIGLVELKELMDQISLSRLIELIQELFDPDNLHDLISVDAIKKLES